MARKRRGGALRISLPLLAVVAAGLVWCGYWYFAFAEIRQKFAQRDTYGLPLSCAEETWAGFPFRFTLICTDARLQLETADGPLDARASRVSVTALAYRPNHVIAEATAPAIVTLPGFTLKSERGPMRAGAKFDLATGSPRELSLRMDDWRGRVTLAPPGEPAREIDVETGSFLTHWEPADGRPDAQRIGLQTEALRLRTVPAAVSGLSEARLETLSGLADLTAFDYRRPPVGPRQWQAAGGRIIVSYFAAKGYDQDIVAHGSLGLDAKGLADGRIETDILDLDKLLKSLIKDGALKENEAVMVATAVKLLSSGAKDIEPGRSRVPVIFSKGRLYAGPFKVTTFPPFF